MGQFRFSIYTFLGLKFGIKFDLFYKTIEVHLFCFKFIYSYSENAYGTNFDNLWRRK